MLNLLNKSETRVNFALLLAFCAFIIAMARPVSAITGDIAAFGKDSTGYYDLVRCDKYGDELLPFGSFNPHVNIVTGNYTALNTDTIVEESSTASTYTITLPTLPIVTYGMVPTTVSYSLALVIKDGSGAAGTNNITVAAAGSQHIDGASSKAISANYGVLRLYNDGTAWFTF